MRDDLDVLADMTSDFQREDLEDWIACRAEGATVAALLEQVGQWQPITYGMCAAEVAARRGRGRQLYGAPPQIATPPDEIAKFLDDRPRHLLEFWLQARDAGMAAPELLAL